MAETAPTVSLAEIAETLAHLPGPDEAARDAARAREARLTKPPGALGRLEELAEWLAAWQGRHPPRLERPRVAVFAGNHGVSRRGVSAWPASVTAEMVRNFLGGGAAVNAICSTLDAELRVYELSLEVPTEDFTRAPAMTDEECARAVAYGMMAVEPGIDALAIGEMGIANTTSAAAIAHVLYGGSAEDWTGPGTGVSGDRLAAKIETVRLGAALHGGQPPLEVLRRLGGFETAAMFGALVAARMGRVPVLGLPGNPVSAGVTTVVFLKPVMETMLGMRSDDGPGETAVLGRDLGGNDHRQDYLRAALALGVDGEAIATPFDVQDSSMMSRLAQADCLVVRPPHAPAAKKGERVRIISLRLGQLSI